MEGAEERMSMSTGLWQRKSRTYDVGAQSKTDGVAAVGDPSALFADRSSSRACDLCSPCRNEL